MAQRGSGYERLLRDCYETPAWVTDALLDRLTLPADARVWEPAAGSGQMIAALRARGHASVASDIAPHPDLDFTADFLDAVLPRQTRSVITNPPYNQALTFIEHALALTEPVGGVVAMLLRVDYDSAARRRHIFADCPAFRARMTLTRRIRWFEGPRSPSENHAWFIWDWTHQGPPEAWYGP